jgi:large subunit ribosomal protein L10
MRARIAESEFIILADYQGLNVTKTQDLRRRLLAANARMQVIKNRLYRYVAKELGRSGLDREITGPSAMVFGRGDIVQVAKVLKDFIKENERPVIKIGTMGDRVLTPDDVQQLANLPSREILLGRAVGTIAAPMSSLVGVLSQKVSSLLYALNALVEKKSKTESASNA